MRLQGQSRICVIEHHDEIVGWNAASLRRVSTPEPFILGYLAQAYILADHQSSGAYWPASAQNMAWLQEVADQNFWYLNVGNDRSKNFTQGAEYWSLPVCDLSIACRCQMEEAYVDAQTIDTGKRRLVIHVRRLVPVPDLLYEDRL
jgi:hypothetical protein